MTPVLTPTMISRGDRNAACIRDVAVLHEQSGWSVTLECSLAAETRRVFQALTVPEHIETWFSLPCCQSHRGNIASWMPNGFMLVHACNNDHSSTTITSFYSACRTRKLAFSWTLGGDAEPTRTYVDIRLQGDFERSTLRLQHHGFRSEEEYRWHQRLWSASLSRLGNLFDPPSGVMRRSLNDYELC